MDYICSSCKASDVKLWRQYNTVLTAIKLLCCSCSEKNQNVEFDRTFKNGDQIGWLVPAVPTEDNETFWGYTSVPQHLVDWWKNLSL